MNTGLNVYLVDDDYIFSVIAKVTLCKLYGNVNFVWLPNGEDALQAIAECKEQDLPTILFLDINMPVMGGWDFLTAIKQDEKHFFPICITSSSIDPKDRKMAEENPRVIDFIEKPFSNQVIKNLIDPLIE